MRLLSAFFLVCHPLAAWACPPDSTPQTLDGALSCVQVRDDQADVVDREGRRLQSGPWVDGQRQGWWTAWDRDGHLLGETWYERGTATQGLRAPRDRPRCLAIAPPDGSYAAQDAGEALGQRVAVVSGCVAAQGLGAQAESTQIAGRDRFQQISSDAKRCNSGVTVVYEASPDGLVGRERTWTNCGGALSRWGTPTALQRQSTWTPLAPEAYAPMLEGADRVQAAAALEAVASKQPADWTCELLSASMQGSYGPDLVARSITIAASPCLIGPLRHMLLDRQMQPAAEPLAELIASPEALSDVLARSAALGQLSATRTLADRLARLGSPPQTLRDALATELITARPLPEPQQAITSVLERFFANASDGEAMLQRVGRDADCAGTRAALALVPVQAYLAQGADPRLLKRVRRTCTAVQEALD